MICSFLSNKSFAQLGDGVAYCVDGGASIVLEPINTEENLQAFNNCDAENWNITLENFCLFSSGCANTDGLFDFTVSSSEVMTELRIDLEALNNVMNIATTVIPNSTTFSMEDLFILDQIIPPSTTNNIGDYQDIAVMDASPDPYFDNKFNLIFSIKTDCSNNVPVEFTSHLILLFFLF